MRRLLRGETAKTLLEGHARAARAEMTQIAHEFKRLASVASVPTPAMDRLRAALDPAASPLPDGSASMPLGW